MEIEKLIEALGDLEMCAYGYHINGEVLGMDCTDFECLMADAAEEISKISALQAENDRLRRERDSAVKDISDLIDEVEEIRRGYGIGDSDADKALADMCGNYCENEGDGCYIEGEKYHCENFKWRGPQKEE